MDENIFDFDINLNDIDYTMKRGSGPGGQNRNKVESCVVAVHRPTGLSVKIDARDQHKNKALATRLLVERIRERESNRQNADRHAARKQQVGSGMRGDKRRTYRSRDDVVVDHVTGMKWKLSRWIKGEW